MPSHPPQTAPFLPHPKYRPDIDGLRAIAVLSVLGFHAFPSWVPGGFIGVDIFFVISGYLISAIIFGSMALAGEGFSYRVFYERRVRRIFPALVVVMAVAAVFGWFVLLSDEFGQLGKHLLTSASFVVNFALWNEAGYFDTSAEVKPLLHLWSLSVEEQFYILWPLVLGLAWRLGRGRVRTVRAWMWGVTGLSFLLNVALIHHASVATFYLPHSRVWELGAGALLAIGGPRPAGPGAVRRELHSVAGLLLIALGLGLITAGKSFPGWWALLPVLGACLCVSAGPSAWLNRHVLGSRILVWFGLISYPLYLWHWPLLSYLRIVEGGEPALAHRALAIVAAVLLAWLTYRLVEQKLRHREGHGVVWALVAAMTVIALVGAAAWLRVLPPRHNDPILQKIVAAHADWAYPEGLRTDQLVGEEVYRIGAGKTRVLLLGDSHIEQYAPRAVELDRIDPLALNTLYFATRGACPPIPGLYVEDDPGCGKRRDKLAEFALSPAIDAVVLGACWDCYFDVAMAPVNPPAGTSHYYYYIGPQGQRHLVQGGDGMQRSLEGLEAYIRRLRAAGKEVYLVLNAPVGEGFDPKQQMHGSRLDAKMDVSSSMHSPLQPIQRLLHDALQAIAERTGAVIIDPMAQLCDPGGLCLRSDPDGVPIYKDSGHLRASYVRRAASYMDSAFLARR